MSLRTSSAPPPTDISEKSNEKYMKNENEKLDKAFALYHPSHVLAVPGYSAGEMGLHLVLLPGVQEAPRLTRHLSTLDTRISIDNE